MKEYNSITPAELHQKLKDGQSWQLIDVREAWEHEAFNIGGLLIPLEEVVTRIDEIETGKPVVFYCEHGIRSALAIQRILQKRNFGNIYNLKGGMAAWKMQEKL